MASLKSHISIPRWPIAFASCFLLLGAFNGSPGGLSPKPPTPVLLNTAGDMIPVSDDPNQGSSNLGGEPRTSQNSPGAWLERLHPQEIPWSVWLLK